MGRIIKKENKLAEKNDRLESMNNVVNFLHANYPKDLLMPVKIGTKHPEFPHKGDSWSWSQYFKLKEQERCDGDVCLLLHDLCVVDVDDKDVAEQLEIMFPILREVPYESTQKGCHYWFTRPLAADELDYFDGAAQRRPKIDFKSICSTQTSGVIVIAPSTNKTWIRNLWSTPLQEMPFTLLDYVASPKKTSRPRKLSFDDGTMIEVEESGYLNIMSYFEPFDDDIQIDIIPVPCSKQHFTELYHVLQCNELSFRNPSRSMFKNLLKLADKLGLKSNVMRRISYGIPRFQLDMFEACPTWWTTLMNEKIWRSQGATDESILININEELSRCLLYEPLECMSDTNMWLFPNIKVPKYDSKHVLIRHPLKSSTYPDIVLSILLRYRTHLVLAGGAVLGVVGRWIQKGTDYDIFIVGLGIDEASTMLNEIRSEYVSKICKTIRTGNAITLLIGNDTIVQIILRLYTNVAQVLVGFDLAPSKIGAYYDNDGRFVIKAAPSWVPAMRHMAFPIDTTKWGYASVVRHLKYKKKGFQVYIPGDQRAALNDFKKNAMILKNSHGLAALFRAEFCIIQDRWCDKGRPLSSCEVRKSTRKLKYNTDYGAISKTLGALSYIVKALFKGAPCPCSEIDQPYIFAMCDPSKPCMAMFHPLNPNVWEAYDLVHLSKLLEIA